MLTTSAAWKLWLNAAARADAFPELHRRYFDEIIAPRRDAMNQAIRRGIAAGEIRPDVDVDLLSEVLVAPILARMASGDTEDLDPAQTSRSITALVFAGAAPR
jgi:Tetracyclin repressor-like, C-terminal domain